MFSISSPELEQIFFIRMFHLSSMNLSTKIYSRLSSFDYLRLRITWASIKIHVARYNIRTGTSTEQSKLNLRRLVKLWLGDSAFRP